MEFICEYKNSIPDLLCEKIIEIFESIEDKPQGITLGGLHENIKDTTNYNIPNNNDKWKKIEVFLYKELSNKLSKYFKTHKKSEYSVNNDFFSFTNKNIYTHNFMIQKYDKKKGKYIYHNDFHFINNSARVITYIWYLNTVEDGGETVFWDNYKIKPEQGKLVLFPSFWCFPHCGKMPLSSDKYIITGWLYDDI